MKKSTLIAAIMLFISYTSNAQITLSHSFSLAGGNAEIEVVNLSLSGKKILVMNERICPDTLYFYNLDYSFWKKIVCPCIPGYYSQNNFYDNSLGRPAISIFYPSETLFNTDSLLEVAVAYYHNPSPSSVTIFIINESGMVTDSITNGATNMSQFGVFETSPGVFKATFTTNDGANIYDLPGTIPCNNCSSPLGLAKNEKQNGGNIITQPQPNPSSNEVKITFTLPEGANRGELILYNSEGQKIKKYQVDNRFGFIMLDNSQLPSGMYYYNIVANGIISSTQKMVLVK